MNVHSAKASVFSPLMVFFREIREGWRTFFVKFRAFVAREKKNTIQRALGIPLKKNLIWREVESGNLEGGMDDWMDGHPLH